MRKAKTGVFRGAWMNGKLNERELRPILRNEIVLSDHDAIIAALSRAMEIWRFDLEKRATEPEPADWAELVAAIKVSWPMDHKAVDSLRNQVWSLPLHVVAVLNDHLFQAEGIGTTQLFERMMPTPSESDFLLIASALEGLSEATLHARGIRGPKADRSTPLRQVVAELMRQGLKIGRAMEVASDLLNKCGIRTPTSRSQLSELMRD